MSERVKKTVLENGIRVLSETMPGIRSVSVGVLVDAGSKDEGPTEQGYAHLIEHMLFQGTGDRDAQEIAAMMEIGGGAMGAFTARDYTVYHATVLDEYLPFALEALGDMLCNSVIPADALRRQRSVIKNEMSGDDDPFKATNSLLKQHLWPGHPLAHPTAGTRESIQAATRQTLLAYMERYYTAERLVIAAAGNVDHEQFVAQVRDSFWQMNGTEQVSPAAPPPDPQQGLVVAAPRDLQQVYMSAAWAAPPYTHPERYAWHVFSAMFGGGPTSRLYRRLREELGMVYHVSADYQAYGSAGALVVEGATMPSTVLPVVANMLLELHQMSGDTLDRERHYRTVQSLRSQHLVSGDSAYVRMSRLALQEHYFNRPVSSESIVDEIGKQTIENVQDVATQIMMSGLPVIALVGPVSDQHLAAITDMLGDFGAVKTVRLAEQHTAPVLA